MIANSRCRGRLAGAAPRITLCHRERSPLRSRPRRCAISSSTEFLVEVRPLLRFFRIASGRLLHRSYGRTFAILNAINPALVGHFGNEIEAKLFANDTGEEAAYRMLLPFSRSHYGSDSCATRRPQHRE